MNSATINMGMQVSFLYIDVISFGYIPRSGISVQYGIYIFSLPRNSHTVLVTILIYIPINIRVAFFSTFLPALATFCFLFYYIDSNWGYMDSSHNSDVHFSDV